MKITKDERDCSTCEYHNIMTGYCRSKNKYTHSYNEVCEKWLKAKELREKKAKRKDKAYKKERLF